jgi:murein L,D-transpeptidase YafK
MHHIVNGDAMLYRHASTSLPLGTLAMRTPVHRLDCSEGWCRVRTDAGRVGYVRQAAVSNVWIRISKRDRRLFLYQGTRLVDTFNADFGYNPFGDKEQRGSQQQRDHWRTPDGAFFVVRKNPNSVFHKALVLNYPTAADARRGLRRGLISQSEHNAIVEAEAQGTMPPMNTALGGWIEIHGDGTGAATTWTQGCVAVHNEDINRLWLWVPVGTPVLIE